MKLRDEWKWMIPVAVVCLVVFANSFTGEFVYDDLRQILRNQLIQENALIGKALTSDVWAFKGDGTIAASNYWRPTFTLWHIINFRLFGTNPYGWHVTNLLLHLGVCLLAYLLLRRWGLSQTIACAVALVFAVHPVHVESVSWISGSPDLLFALAFLGSLWFAHNYADDKRIRHLVFALILYAVALGAKEIALLCLPFYYLVLARPTTGKPPKQTPWAQLCGFGVVATIYFLARIAVLGGISHPPEESATPLQAILSLPEIFAFYLRQIFFPYWMSPNYSVQPVSVIGVTNFFLPLIISVGGLALLVYLARRVKYGWLALMLFLLPLLPAMNATAFVPEHIVHDRYLYLPLLGVLMLVLPFVARFISEKQVLVAGAVVCLVFGIQTITYNRVWASGMSLWSWSVQFDNSTFSSMQYGFELAEIGRYDEAIKQFTNSINARPTARNYLGRGRAYLSEQQYDAADKDLARVLQFPQKDQEAYVLYQTYEALAIAYSEQQQYDAAIATLTEARRALPIYSASLTADLAIVLHEKGQPDQALKELEAVQTQARREMLPEAKTVFLRLGMLYVESGRKDEARNAFREFLQSTATYNDKTILEERAEAQTALQGLN